ncbi:MAG: prepilin-type N-terminal cleavage/methylation domain-containing protein [Gemmatimonadaceae bacterium]
MNRARKGLSLIELVVVVALAGLVGGAIGVTLTRQQRFYRGAAEVGYVREAVRDAMDVLAIDIRQMSVGDTVRLRADSAIEFFSTIGVSAVCQEAGAEVGLPGLHSSGNSLSAFLMQPDTGDVAAFYSYSEVDGEKWERHRISDVAARSLGSSCPPVSRFTVQADLDARNDGLVLTLTSPLSGVIEAGAPVRFLRRGRYSLYHSSDGWYLGYRRCNAIGQSVCGAIQPISGTYRPYSIDPAASGLLFEYFDRGGQRLDPTSSPLTLARVDVTARGESGRGFSMRGENGRISDSATITVAIRNGAR